MMAIGDRGSHLVFSRPASSRPPSAGAAARNSPGHARVR